MFCDNPRMMGYQFVLQLPHLKIAVPKSFHQTNGLAGEIATLLLGKTFMSCNTCLKVIDS